MSLLAAFALSLTVPFIPTLDEPAPTAQAPAPAVQPAPPVEPKSSSLSDDPLRPQQALRGATPRGALTDVVSEAIKRKLERVKQNQAGGSGIPTPPRGGETQPSITFAPVPSSFTVTPAAEPTATAPVEPTAPSVPDVGMIPSGATMMMGDPQSGGASFIRAVPQRDQAQVSPVTAPVPEPIQPQANPMARSTDTMEVGTSDDAAASQPGPHHTLLDLFVGTWDVTANFDTGPGQPPETASGQMVNSWQLDGRWLKQEYSGRMSTLGGFRGVGFLGYDNLQKAFVGTWMDTLSTSCMMSKGDYDASSRTFTLGGEFAGPGGAKFRQKQVISVLSPDRYVVSMYLTGPDGVEFKTGNLEYVRSVRTIMAVPNR